MSLLIVSKVLLKKKLNETCDIDGASYGDGIGLKSRCKMQQIRDIVFGMVTTVFKMRPHFMTLSIILQIGAFALYYVTFGSSRLEYLFARKSLGWAQEEYITLKIVRKCLGIAILIFVLPLLKRFHISDIKLIIAFNLLHCLGFLVASFSMYISAFIYIGKIFKTESFGAPSNSSLIDRLSADSFPIS